MTDSFTRYGRLLVGGQPRYVLVNPNTSRHELLDGLPWDGGQPSGETAEAPGDTTPWLCPVAPSKIIGIGRNYRKHAEELSNAVPEEPLMFFKPPSSLAGPGGEVVLPPESDRVDFEGELALIIGRRCRRVSVEAAPSCIFGYSVACDVTARDLQRTDKQWTRAKGFDTFCPVGPHVVQVSTPDALRLRLRIGDTVRQDGTTADMIFNTAQLVSYVSQSMTLEPGDVILTGTPEGVGPLTAGDHVHVEIEHVGTLSFHVSGSQ
jgi:2-keto-4-pentenoate hydratase/2-oxohepta-3-ene-1,7-dioic acid hydratase in catechol pathway